MSNGAVAIDVRDVVKTYALGGVEVRASAACRSRSGGEYVAIMVVRFGKSTLMNLLGCLDRPSAGSYVLDGIDVSTSTTTRSPRSASRSSASSSRASTCSRARAP